jgi:hypothetical protein
VRRGVLLSRPLPQAPADGPLTPRLPLPGPGRGVGIVWRAPSRFAKLSGGGTVFANQKLRTALEGLLRGAQLQSEELERLVERIDRSIRRASPRRRPRSASVRTRQRPSCRASEEPAIPCERGRECARAWNGRVYPALFVPSVGFLAALLRNTFGISATRLRITNPADLLPLRQARPASQPHGAVG